MRAIRLRTEYLRDPIGVDFQHPRLMWNAEGGVRQTAYQIVTGSWDSGRVESASMRAEYPKALRDRERVNWKIRLWDENGEPGERLETTLDRLGFEDAVKRILSGEFKQRKEQILATAQ